MIEHLLCGLIIVSGILFLLLVGNILVARRMIGAWKSGKTCELEKTHLRQSFETALDVSHASVFDNDLVNGKARISPELFLHLGYTPAEVPQSLEEINSIIHQDDLKAVWESVERHARDEVPMYTAEFRIRSKSGEWVWCDGRGKIVERDSDGKPARLFGISMDISERKRAEDQLLASEKKYRSLFVNASDAIILLRDGRIYDCNPMAEKLYRMPREELTGMTPADLSPEYQPDRKPSGESVAVIINRVMNGESLFINWVHRRKDGTSFYSEISLNRLDLPDGVYIQGMLRDITARMQADEKIKASESRYRRLIEGMMDAYCQVDLEGRIIYANMLYARMLGYSPDEIYGKTYQQITPVKWHAFEKEIIETQVMTRGYSEVYEKEYIRKDGTAFPIELKVYATRDDAGIINGLAGVVRDISARKAIELSLQKERDFTRTLIETTPVFIVAIAGNGETIMMNHAMLDALGYDAYEIKGTNYLKKFVPPAEHESVMLIFRNIEYKHQTVNVNSVLRKDGTLITVEWHGQPVFTPEGELDYIFGIGIDITEKKRAQEALRESDERYRALVSFSPEAIILTGPDGRLLFLNKAAVSMHGYNSADELVGTYSFDLIAPQQRTDMVESFKRTLEGEVVRDFETVLLRRDGTSFPALVSATVFRDEKGEVLYVIVLPRDISERKEAEREILALNDELEERVLARTAELKSSNEELEAFSYSVSHDLRAPVRIIENFSKALIEDFQDSMPGEALAYLERIRKTCFKTEQLIDDLLKLSRITSAEMNLSSVNITSMSRDIISELQYGPNGHPVEFSAHGEYIARGDPALLRIALYNLLSNAMKFTSRIDNPVIELGVTGSGENRVYWVRDNGAGFDQAYANRLFGAFQRLHSPADFEGTGIGLAIVRRIIRRHGGNIRAEGAVGRGATFYFTLGYDMSDIF